MMRQGFDAHQNPCEHGRGEAYSTQDVIPGRQGIMLKLIACITYFLTTLPVVQLLYCLISGAINYFAIAAMLAGVVFGWLCFHVLTGIKPWLKVVFTLTVVAAAVYSAAGKYHIAECILTGAASFTLWMICFSACRKPALVILNARNAMMPVLSAAVVQTLALFMGGDYPALEPLREFSGWIGAICGIAAIVVINRLVLHMAAASGQGFQAEKPLVSGNTVLTAVILAIIAVVSFLDEVKAALKYLVAWIVNLMLRLMEWIGSLFMTTAAEQVPEQMPTDMLPEAGTESFLSLLLEWVVKVLVIAALAAGFLYLLFLAFKSILKLIRKIIQYINGIKAEKMAVSYVDEEESAFDLEKIKNRIKLRMAGFAAMFKQRQRLEDMPGNREKLRFLYRAMLQKFAAKNHAVPESMTPDELNCERFGDQNSCAFFNSYNRARYSQYEISDQEVKNAGDVVGRV